MKELFKRKNKRITIISIISFVVTVILGVISHFLYEWTGKSFFAALISGVNVSTWEHLKLLFVPFFIMTVIEYFIYGKNCKTYFSSRLMGILAGMVSIVTLYYTYTGIIGKNISFVNISIFVIGAFIAYYVSLTGILLCKRKPSYIAEIISVFAFIAILILFFVFTFNPPKINLFLDPVTGTYGAYDIK